MSAKHTISINGQAYDAITGLPLGSTVRAPQPTPNPASPPVSSAKPDVHREPAHSSTSVHQQLHKSSTLRRGPLTAPKAKAPASAPARHTAGHVAKSPMISHFAAHPKPLPKNRPVKMINDIGPAVRQAVTTPSSRPQVPAKQVKERLIAQAGHTIDRTIAEAAKPKKPKRVPLLKRLKKQHLVAAGVAFVLLGGYVAYLNVPGLSVRLAAAQAGVNAKCPEYNPDGYSFQGPVAFEQGEVELRYTSNGGGEGYTIIQKNSNWNSVAVLDNLVSKQTPDGDHDTYSIGGVTVYTYGTNAAWTNGGILYEIQGKAPLSSEQLVHIASSM